MGRCIICDTSVDGHVCSIHEEDVVFEFRGSRAGQLTSGRYYRGSVDGFADFGVFIDIGERVTGLLHRSELNRRLESLDWQPGDTVYVQVTDIQDNGNVDLSWSIRQSDDDFRGVLVDDPSGDRLLEEGPGEDETDGEASAETVADESGTEVTTAEGTAEETARSAGTSVSAAASTDSTPVEEDNGSAGSATAVEHEPEHEPEPTYARTEIASLPDRVGDTLRVEGEITDIHQTTGPTVFEVRDETGVVECAAFESAGVRAYPAVEVGDIVRLDGTIERHGGDIQVETAALAILDAEDQASVESRLDEALSSRAEPDSIEPLVEDERIEALEGDIRNAATAIRRAVFNARPVIVRHDASADGYAAGGAIERAVLPLVEAEHRESEATYYYFDRRPLDGEYDMDAATTDVTRMLSNRDRHGEKLPLVVFVGVGSARESRDGFDLLAVYDADRVVIDAGPADDDARAAVDAIVNPHLVDGDSEGEPAGVREVPTTGALAATVAAAVTPDVRGDLRHVPAVSSREPLDEAYTELAAEAGYDADAVGEIREALALVAYYQSYDDKRELVADLLFDRRDLAEHVAARYREELEAELRTAEANLDRRADGEVSIAVLDTEAFTHRFDFPPTGLLLEALHRRQVEEANAGEDTPVVTVGLAEDELRYRSTDPVDDRAVAAATREQVPDAGLTVRGGTDGRFEFLLGEREAVLETVLGAIVDELRE